MADQYQIPLDRTANTPVTEGIHPFSISDITEGISKSQNPMWTVTLSCLTPGEEGKTATLFLVLTEAARWKLEIFLDAVIAPKTGAAQASQFLNRKLRCQITHEEYEGRMQAKVGDMWPMTTALVGASKVSKVTPAATKVAGAVKPTVKSTAPKVRGVPADVAGDEADE